MIVVGVLVLVIIYWVLAVTADPATFARHGISPYVTAGTATTAALFAAEGGYQPVPPNGPVEPYPSRLSAKEITWDGADDERFTVRLMPE